MTTQPDHPSIVVPRARIHVYRLPRQLSDGYCFGRGNEVSFLNVDWFDAVIAEGREPLTKFIKTKRYYDPAAGFLVLADHSELTFTINPETIP